MPRGYIKMKGRNVSKRWLAANQHTLPEAKPARQNLASRVNDPEFILHTGRTLSACWDAHQTPGPELQSAVLLMLAELKRRVDRLSP